MRVKHDDTIESRMVERVMKEGKIESEKEKIDKAGKIIKNDAVKAPKGKLTVTDAGAVTMLTPESKTEPIKEVKFESVTPATRRAATLLMLAMFAPSTMVTEMSTDKTPPPAPDKTPAPTPGKTP